MRHLSHIKSVILALLLALGMIAQGNPVQAAPTQSLIVAGGCFWCVESDFESVPGVIEAVSGYTGGTTKNPTYKAIGKGGTGHYEAVLIQFNPDQVSRETLLHMFFRSVDPTDAGGQFCDRGEMYRTAIFVTNAAEKAAAQSAKRAAAQALGRKIVTPILPAKTFYKAEAFHQDYYKGSKRVLTRFGPLRQSKAYKQYRKACGRDQTVRALWGAEAAFAH